jgi:hypothetical protein
MLSYSISYSDLKKIPYSADTTEREDRGEVKGGPKTGATGGRQGDFMDNSN